MGRRLLYIFAIILSLLIVSCSKRPSCVLPEDKMVSLLVDMELAEAYVNTQGYSSTQERLEIGEQVLEAHGVSPETLDTTLAWYGRNVDKYTALFDKVDKEISKRKDKYTRVPGVKEREADNLWPYAEHLIISPRSGFSQMSFSLPNPAVEKGSILEFKFHLPNNAQLKGTLGVEYMNGDGEATVMNNTSRNKVEITLQTDTAKEISRIYGSLFFKEKNAFPVYLDSIAINVNPLDSAEYRTKRRNQKRYGVLAQQPQPKKPANEENSNTPLHNVQGRNTD